MYAKYMAFLLNKIVGGFVYQLCFKTFQFCRLFLSQFHLNLRPLLNLCRRVLCNKVRNQVLSSNSVVKNKNIIPRQFEQ